MNYAWRLLCLSLASFFLVNAAVGLTTALLSRAADPEREYAEVVLPAKLRYAADYVDHATLATDLQLIGLTLKSLIRRE